MNRSTTYYKPKEEKRLERIAEHEKDLQDVKEAFEAEKENYGARQIKTELMNREIVMSRRKIGRLMRELGLISAYGIPKYTKPGSKSAETNKSDVSNLIDRNFSGWSVGENKTADLVLLAFAMVGIDRKHVMIFHTDRGMELCAAKIDAFLEKHGIIRSRSQK